MNASALTLRTIGHSTRPIEEFLHLLGAHRIQALGDVRRFAGSRKYPHFNPEALRAAQARLAVEYVALPQLGGRRRPRPDSHNTAWRNEAFRGYADYMETPEFIAGIEQLLALARRKPTAIMCAEAVWWRCHRSLIADYLQVRGVQVRHILGPHKVQVHPYTSAASVHDGVLSYAADDLLRPAGTPS
jgi:uncharacterized protein (DUF488 family)